MITMRDGKIKSDVTQTPADARAAAEAHVEPVE